MPIIRLTINDIYGRNLSFVLASYGKHNYDFWDKYTNQLILMVKVSLMMV